MKRRLASVALLVCAASWTGCEDDPRERPDGTATGPRTTHPEGDGPLKAPIVTGVRSIHPPDDAKQWQASFGSLLLCAERSSDAPVLRGVRYETQVAPKQINTWLRRVPSASDRQGLGDWAPILTRLGSPQNFVGNPSKAAGTLTTALDGETVTASCRATPNDPYVEIVTTFEVNEQGARTDAILVDYTINGRAYTLEVNDSYIACGSGIPDPEYCPSAG